MLKKIAVIGAGPAGLSLPESLPAERGDQVTIFEASIRLVVNLILRKRFPVRKSFYETLRYFKRRIELQPRIQLAN